MAVGYQRTNQTKSEILNHERHHIIKYFPKKTKTTESQDSHSNYPKDTIYSRQKCHILVTLRGECPRTTQAICCFLFLLSPLFTHLSNPPPLLSLLEYSACFIEWGFLTIHKEKGLRCLNQICCNFCA